MLRLSGAGESHVGLVRAGNEDSGYLGPGCILVADGVGGGAAGEVASASTAFAVAQAALQRQGHDPMSVLLSGLRQARAQLIAGVGADPARAGMATTLTAFATDGVGFAMVHLGDSRGYLYRGGVLHQLTRDHTYVRDLIEEGRLSVADAAEHPWRNVVLRTVNASSADEPDVAVLELVPGDRLLLASDGLTDLVEDDVIAEILHRHDDDDAVAALLAATLARGGRDNVTCIVATVVDGPPVAADGRLLGAVCDPQNVIDIAPARSSPA